MIKVVMGVENVGERQPRAANAAATGSASDGSTTAQAFSVFHQIGVIVR